MTWISPFSHRERGEIRKETGVFLGSIQRTILLDLFKIFSVALIVLTSLILMAGVIAEAMKNGLGPGQILTAIPLLLPSMLPYTVPTTTLFATCIVYGRLAADNEILALKAAGVHIVHVVWPALLLGAVSGAGTMYLSLDAIPYTHFLLRSQVTNDFEELLYTMLRKDGCFRHPKVNFEIYVKRVEGRALHGVQFLSRARDGTGIDMVCRAKEAELHVDLANSQLLVDMRQCEVFQNHGVTGYLAHRVWPIELPSDWAEGAKARSTDMTWSELSEAEEQMERDKQKISREIDLHETAIRFGYAPDFFNVHVRNKIHERKFLDLQIFQVRSEFHMRPGFALGCLCFALVGCPVGIWFSRSDYLSAFILCFLPIVIVYYPLMFCTINLARYGKVPPVMVIYTADVLMLMTGLVLFRRLTRN